MRDLPPRQRNGHLAECGECRLVYEEMTAPAFDAQLQADPAESIFPGEITSEMTVKDYKMVYYNPWDAQYLSYLVVEYDDINYALETKRLENYPSTEYKGYYGAEGFPENYELLASRDNAYRKQQIKG